MVVFVREGTIFLGRFLWEWTASRGVQCCPSVVYACEQVPAAVGPSGRWLQQCREHE